MVGWQSVPSATQYMQQTVHLGHELPTVIFHHNTTRGNNHILFCMHHTSCVTYTYDLSLHKSRCHSVQHILCVPAGHVLSHNMKID